MVKGETPGLIDEWQIEPKLWDAVRFEVDRRDEFPRFILTGSSIPPDFGEIFHTKTAIRTSDTRYFTDQSIAVAAMGIGSNDLINDLSTMGFYFENMCIRDLRVYADSLDGKIYHYKGRNGLECDAVIHLRNKKHDNYKPD